MSNDDGKLLVYAVLGFGAGIWTFFKGFRIFRESRVVADTPVMHIRGIPMGLVQIRGQAMGEQTLTSPLTHTPCYLYQVVIEQWHSDSKGGGEWKHCATDVQSTKFYLQDATGNALIEAAGAELDLPKTLCRQIRSGSTAVGRGNGGVAALPANAANDVEILKYVEEAKMRHVGQLVGKGVGLLNRGGSEPSPQRQSLMSFLADPTGEGGEGFRGQMMRAMLARHGGNGDITGLALEVWKHPQGSPEFQAALQRCGEAYARTMGANPMMSNPAAVNVYIQAHSSEVLAMVASVAAAAEPQADPETEKARQTAIAYNRQHLQGMLHERAAAASGHFKLTEYCLVPGQTYDITGTCAENPNPRDGHDRNLLRKGTNEPTFLISSKTEKQVASSLRKRAVLMVLGGAALAVVCLAILLGKLGLF